MYKKHTGSRPSRVYSRNARVVNIKKPTISFIILTGKRRPTTYLNRSRKSVSSNSVSFYNSTPIRGIEGNFLNVIIWNIYKQLTANSLDGELLKLFLWHVDWDKDTHSHHFFSHCARRPSQCSKPREIEGMRGGKSKSWLWTDSGLELAFHCSRVRKGHVQMDVC